MTDLPAEAVEAAARAIAVGLGHATIDEIALAALTAAAPYIVAQVTADLRAGIEALRDELERDVAAALEGSDPWARSWANRHLDALDALLRERAR